MSAEPRPRPGGNRNTFTGSMRSHMPMRRRPAVSTRPTTSPARLALGAALLASVIAAESASARKVMLHDSARMRSVREGFVGTPLGPSAAPAAVQLDHLRGTTLAAVAGGALVADADSGQLVLTGAGGVARARLAIGMTTGQLVVAPGGTRAYVADRGGDRIAVVDVVGDSLRLGRSFATATEPFGLALTPDGRTLLVTAVADRALVAYDAETGRERWRRPLASEPRGVAISPSGAQVLVAYLGTGTVERIVLGDGGATGSQHVALDTGTVAGSDTGRAFARNAFAVGYIGHGLAIIPHQLSTPMQAASGRENVGSYGGGFEPPITHRLAYLDDAGRQVALNLAISQPQALTWDEQRDVLYVAGYGADAITTVTRASQASAALGPRVTLPAGCGPTGLDVDADGRVLTWCALTRNVVTYRPPPTTPEEVARAGSAVAAPLQAGPVLTTSRLSKLAQRGLTLFRAGGDARLSSRGAMACANCHPEGRADGLSWRIESKALQTPLLSGRVAGTHPYKWDGGDKDLTTSLTSTMRRLGGAGLSKQDTRALAAYLSVIPAPRRPARAADQVARGRALFASDELGCQTCHNGAMRTDRTRHQFDSPGLPQVDTPSLIGLAVSAPYYHDGSAASLREVLTGTGLVHGMADSASLDDGAIGDLVAFLETL